MRRKLSLRRKCWVGSGRWTLRGKGKALEGEEHFKYLPEASKPRGRERSKLTNDGNNKIKEFDTI